MKLWGEEKPSRNAASNVHEIHEIPCDNGIGGGGVGFLSIGKGVDYVSTKRR
jgi:hypothetical protein